MAFVLTREQAAVRDMARKFCSERTPVAHLRRLRDTGDATGFSREVWREMAALGFAGITVPEAHGGAGLGFAELGLVLEACGRHLTPSPLVSTALLGTSALALGGSEAQRAAHLPAIAAGALVVAL